MRLCRLCRALGRSVGRSAACYVTYWLGKRQNARQNGSQRAYGMPWGLVGPVLAARGTPRDLPRSCNRGQLFEGTRGAAPDLAGRVVCRGGTTARRV